MQHIFICGAKSVGHYGGYETFVEMLARYCEQYPDIQLHIFCKANGDGSVNEAILDEYHELQDNVFEFHGAHCIKVKVPNLGPATAIWYDTAAVLDCLRYCKRSHIESPILYILTCRIGVSIGWLVRKLRALNGTFHLNPDGHEWARQKWPAPVRCYWKWSEAKMVKAADLVICDSLKIEDYIQEEYHHPNTTYIAYGAELTPSPLADDDAKYQGWLHEHGLVAGEYYLVVCRFVPENNIETILREFLKSHSRRKLVLITTLNHKFREALDEEYHFQEDGRVCFPGPVYEQKLLRKLRENAYAYLHGHEVGGTNPSLLEALGATKLNLLLDVGFNREVAQDAALYWTKEPGSLAALFDKADALPAAERERLGTLAKECIRTRYSWPFIASEYHDLWAPKPEAPAKEN